MKQLILMICLGFHFISYAQYQVQKGRWMISHTIGGFNSVKTEYKQYEEDELNGQFTQKNTGFQLAFIGPDWGYAQISKTRNIDDNTGTETKQGGFGFYLRPQAGYFITDNLVIGANILIGIETANYEGDNDKEKERYTEFGIGPSLRYYIGKNQKQKPFVGFESRFDVLREKDIEDESGGLMVQYYDYRNNGSRVMVKPFVGYAWFLGKRWTAEARIDYFMAKETLKQTANFYVDGSLDSEYPQSAKYEISVNTIALNFGIGYTF